MTLFQPLIIFIFQIVVVYFLSRVTLNQLFYTLRIFFHKDDLVFSLISLIFLPGTIIHEIAHYLAATILMLKVRDVVIFPRWEGNQIKLGSVLFEKKDVVRSLLVGIAPIIAALIFFWLLYFFKLFPRENFLLNLAMGYVIFSVSSTMFSSRQDLQDLIFILPGVIIVVGIFYILDIRIDILLKDRQLIDNFLNIISQINFFLFVSIAINVALISFLKILRIFSKK